LSRVYQEFYCNDCDGYFGVKLNMAINVKALICCPNCGRQHPRCIINGEIHSYGDVPGNREEEIIVPKSAYHKKSEIKRMQEANKHGSSRNGVVVEHRSPDYERLLEMSKRQLGEID
jgi:hypothetical protein